MTDDGRDPATGRLRPGHSVAPKQRWHPGQPTEAEQIRAYLAPKKQAVLDKLAELAVAGDPRSQQLFLAYIAPPPRIEDERVNIPGFAQAETLAAKAEAVIGAAASGACSTAAAERLLRVLDVYQRATKTDEFEARLKAIEAGARTREVIDAAPPESAAGTEETGGTTDGR